MEKEFIAWLIEHCTTDDRRVVIGIGDDAAVLNNSQNQLVVTTDSIADGVHFDSSKHNLEQIGRKAMGVNFSDIAAMGAQPLSATVNFVCPRDFRLEDLQQLFNGMKQMADQFETPIVGGDTNRWNGKLVVGATVLGIEYPQARSGFWTMSGAVQGDWILVSGSLGGSILGKHLDFTPRVALAEYLIQRYAIHAATDISDSLAIDLAAIAEKSGCGFRIFADQIPVSGAAIELARSSRQLALEHALYDGEDFELVLCASESEAANILADTGLPVPLQQIGIVTSEKTFMIADSAHQLPRTLEIRGYVH